MCIKKKRVELLTSDERRYKDLPAKRLLRADALHPACCYFQIPAGSGRFIRSVLVSASPDIPEARCPAYAR